MAVLSDSVIRDRLNRGELEIDPLPPDNSIQPASIDLRLADDFRAYGVDDNHGEIDLLEAKSAVSTPLYSISIGGEPALVLPPNEFILARTIERVKLPHDLVGRVEGKSSLGRIGLAIHATAGYIDPGFDGTITLEMKNVGHMALLLRPYKNICQLSLMTMYGTVARPYGHAALNSKYQGQRETTASRYEG